MKNNKQDTVSFENHNTENILKLENIKWNCGCTHSTICRIVFDTL